MKRIESTQNSLVKHWKKLVTTRKERQRSGEFLVEGFHLVEEALKIKDNVLTIIVREGVDIPYSWDVDGIYLVEVPAIVVNEISDTEHSQGIFAHCKQVEVSDASKEQWTKLLLVDAVQDPGNIGTIIRTADAAGVDAVILGKGSADAYNPKTLRSAQGSHFHIPVLTGNLQEWITKLADKGIAIIGTALEGAVNFTEAKPSKAFALIVGNEGSGIQTELLEQTDLNVTIPLLGHAESLNVAVSTGILLYHFALTKNEA